MPNDGITIAAGRAAWARLKKSRTLEDYLAVGRALLVGRRLAMDKVRATEPKGGKYAKVFARWFTREWLFRNSAQCPQLLDGDRAKREWRLSVDQDAAAGTTPPDLPAEYLERVPCHRAAEIKAGLA